MRANLRLLLRSGRLLREPNAYGLELLSGAGDLEIQARSDDVVVIPYAFLLFNSAFVRAGRDRIVGGDDGRPLVVHHYFAHEKRPGLASPQGATVSALTVEAIVKQTTPGAYAQAGTPESAATAIGRVEKATGSALAIRNGVAVELHAGDLVYQGDVLQTRSASTLGIGFVDGTAFNMTANARMVLNEMVYDPNGTNNSAFISLVQGSISFMAGQVAKTGDMKVDTPVGTMGIRGTIVLVDISANNGTTNVSSVFDPTTGHVGEV